MNTPYNGHTHCHKCGTTHWMHGPCPCVNDPSAPPENTLTHVVWPPVGLTPGQLADYAAVEALTNYKGPSTVDLWRGFEQKGLNAQLQTLGEWCLKRAREQHNTATTRSMLRRKVDQILSPRPLKPGGR